MSIETQDANRLDSSRLVGRHGHPASVRAGSRKAGVAMLVASSASNQTGAAVGAMAFLSLVQWELWQYDKLSPPWC